MIRDNLSSFTFRAHNLPRLSTRDPAGTSHIRHTKHLERTLT